MILDGMELSPDGHELADDYETEDQSELAHYAAWVTLENDRLRGKMERYKWTPAKQALPHQDEWVLVWADGAVNCMAYVVDRERFEDWTNPAFPNVHPDLITHWMPLPPEPEDQDND